MGRPAGKIRSYPKNFFPEDRPPLSWPEGAAILASLPYFTVGRIENVERPRRGSAGKILVALGCELKEQALEQEGRKSSR